MHIEPAFFIGLLIYTKKVKKSNEKRIIKIFVYLYLSRYAVPAFVIPIYLLLSPSSAVKFFLGFICLAFFNLLPFIWIRYFYLPHANSMLRLVENKISLEPIFTKHDISKREQEILKLILDGKNNKEIEEALFISYHTVKNHVYNLYQKLGIKTRYELIHYITRFYNSTN